MRNTLAIARKELSIYFTTPTAYAVYCGMCFIAGMMFLAALGYFQKMSMQFLSFQQPQLLEHLNLTDMVVYPLLRNVGVIFLFMVPVPLDAAHRRREAHADLRAADDLPDAAAGRSCSASTWRRWA